MFTVSCTTCDELQCLNSNPCQSFLTRDNLTQSRCACSGKWAGPRCQHQIRLDPQSVTSSHVTLKVDLMTSDGADVTESMAMSLTSGRKEVELNYTLVFWRRNDTVRFLAADAAFLRSGDISCVLLHKQQSKSPVLQGLLPATRYTICVENGFVDSCLLSSFADSAFSSSSSSHGSEVSSQWPSNCVTVFTSSGGLPPPLLTKSSAVTAVAVVSVLVMVVLVVVLVVFLVRRQSLGARLWMDAVLQGVCESGCQGGCQGGCRRLSCTGEESEGGGGLQDRTRTSLSSSTTSRSIFGVDEDVARVRPKRKKPWLQRLGLAPCRDRHKSSTYTSANMLLSPQPSPSLSAGAGDSFSHLEGSDDDESVFDNSMEDGPAVASLPVINVGRNKPRHRLSRKRRGYVAYSTRKDKNIRLTTVLESPMDDEDDLCGATFWGSGHSSI